jgi:2Fe-2S ferredoxin
MLRLTFVHPDAREETVEVEVGTTVMQAAIANDVVGILAECGGAAMCATCHVYVEPEFVSRLQEIDPVENEMLDSAAAPREASSRLGCQIPLGEQLDGLRVRIPQTQT